jgi:hypothetical protein
MKFFFPAKIFNQLSNDIIAITRQEKLIQSIFKIKTTLSSVFSINQDFVNVFPSHFNKIIKWGYC